MKKIRFAGSQIDAYTEVDLAFDLAEKSNLSKDDCKVLVTEVFELLKKAMVEYDGVLIRKFGKFSKRITRTQIHYHTQEHFEMLKQGKIKNLKELPAEVKRTKPFYRVKLTLSGEMKKLMRETAQAQVQSDELTVKEEIDDNNSDR